MNDWNAVATVRKGGYDEARSILQRYGTVAKSDFFNTLLLRVIDYRELLDLLHEQRASDPESVAALARVMPVTLAFTFQSPEEFETKARQAVEAWLSTLGGKSFYLRMHRRGFKGRLSGQEEERFLDRYLLEALERAGAPGRICFEEPDAVIALETVGQRAGMALWTRADLQRYPLLHLQ